MLCKASNNAYNPREWLILEDILNKRVAEGDTYEPHNFNLH